MPDVLALLPKIGAVLTMGFGCLGLFWPAKVAKFTSIEPRGPLGLAEIRAIFGGFLLALGAACLIAPSTLTYSLVGVAWLGAVVGRLVSLVADRSLDGKNIRAMVVEGLIGVLLLSPILLG